MKLSSIALLVGAVAAQQQQHVLKTPGKHEAGDFAKPLRILHDSLKDLGHEASGVWQEVKNVFPDAIDQFTFFSSPKKHTRRSDSEWDHIVRGGDVQSAWVKGADGQKRREIDGKLDTYDLRVKKVDTSKLGVDPNVKQFSGYLDDNENDKHLFYCKFLSRLSWSLFYFLSTNVLTS